MRTLYFDCFSGISGDMTIGALLDLGLDFGYLQAELGKLPVSGYEVKAARTVRANISAMKFDVVMPSEPASTGRQGNAIESSSGHGHSHDHEHGHAHSHEHSHAHSHGAGGAGFHRRASEILEMIRSSNLSPNARRIAAG